MHCLLAIIVEHATPDALSEAERTQLDRDSVSNNQKFAHDSEYVVARALKSSLGVPTDRWRRNIAGTMDGPFAETRELLAGYLLVNDVDQARAESIASEHPAANFESIEVHEVWPHPASL